METKKHKWAFDIDGVIADTYPTLQAATERMYDVCWFVMPYWPNKHYSNITKQSFYRLFSYLIKENKISIIDDAKIIINKYQKLGNDLIFITNRDVELIWHTYDFLDRYFKNYKLYIGRDLDKLQICINNNIDGIIEDKPETCRIFKQYGLNHILHRQPHQRWDYAEDLNIMNWYQICEKIL